jgi:type II secretory pathway component GspD/PulD (secretin)
MMRKIVCSCCLLVGLLNVAFAENMISKINFKDAAVLDVIDALAKQAEIDLVISGDAALMQAKRTSLVLKNISAVEAIEQVLKTNGISYEKKGKTILVSALPQAEPFRGEIEAISLSYLSADKLSLLLSKVLPGLKSSKGIRANSIVLCGKQRLINEAKYLVKMIDKPIPQVLIESKVIEISKADSMRLGVTYGKEAGSFKFITSASDGRTRLAEDLITTLNGLISEGKANVVATPKIATLDNHEAVINIGSRIPYAVPVSSGSTTTQWTVEYIEAGVQLKITPQVGEAGEVTVALQPEVSSVSEWRSTAAGEFPVITTRNVQSKLRVKNGETIVVGGLLSDSKRENISRVPVLGYIPIVGMIFQNKTIEQAKTEIVFMITPYII